MKIVTTPRELLEKHIWDEACEVLGWSVYVINEGQVDRNEAIELTEEQAIKLGFIPKPAKRGH